MTDPLLDNIIYKTDSYKIHHDQQYPRNTKQIYSYFEARDNATYQATLFFGLQYYLKKYLEGQVVTKEKIDAAENMLSMHFPPGIKFNRNKWLHILNKYDGFLPLHIKAVPEGLLIPKNNVLMTVVNTDPECYWLTNHVETLLTKVWYPSTVATVSHFTKQALKSFLEETCDTPNEVIDFMLHDFGYRGTSSEESAMLGGLAHLINFKGTDTLAAIPFGIKYYNSGVCGFSIPASEHSTITSWGSENELKAFENMLDQYPEGLVACVSDSYDIYRAIDQYWGTNLKEKILNRNGRLVVRPDSGDPVKVLPEVIRKLMNKFGFTTNSKGYDVLHPNVRVIQGDGCTPTSIPKILQALKDNKISVENTAFGMGGGLLQKVDRDTQSFAFKASYGIFTDDDGRLIPRQIYKDPVTDSKKISKKGVLQLIRRNGTYETVQPTSAYSDVMQTVFLNGEVKKLYDFSQIRQNSQN